MVYTFLGFSGFFLTLASLPSWVAANGTSDDIAGLVTTAFLASTICTQALVPLLTRRFGLTPVLIAGLVAIGAPAPLLAVSAELRWVLVISIVRGCGFGILTVLGALLCAQLVPADRRGEAIGLYGLAIAVPNLVAVPVGVALATSRHFEWVAFIGVAPLLAIPAAVALGRSVRDAERVEHSGTHSARSAVRATLSPAVVLLVVTVAGGALLTYLPIVRPSGVTASVSLLAFGATGALSRWLVGSLVDRMGLRLLLPLASVAAIVGLLIVAGGLLSDNGAAAVIVIGSALLGVGFGAVQNLTLVAAFARAGQSQATTASAVWNAGFDGGTAIGAAVVGIAAAQLGTPATFLGAAVLVAASAPLVIFSIRTPQH
ncbi:MAG: MFS transporter [Actinomycetota bacterium]|nr:MFS transporter [Actinomycetota bacterium]